MAYPVYDGPSSMLLGDVPSGEIDPKELERAKYLAMMRLGLGMAGREPLGNAAGGAMKAYIGAEANARQGMLAQLQAYKAKQEIQAKLIAAAKDKAMSEGTQKIFASAPITEAGGPTPANATLALVEQLKQLGVLHAQANDSEGAKRYFDAADKIEGQYGPAVDVKTPGGDIRIARFNDKGRELVSTLAPAKPVIAHDEGGTMAYRDPFTAAPVVMATKTPSIENKIGFGNLAVAQAREARESAAQAAEGGPGAKTRFAAENVLRDEFNRQSTPFITVRDAYRRVKSASEGESSGAGDVALLYGYMKILDPGSTVREGEFATAQQTGGLPGWVVAKYNGIISGERLSTDMRSNIVKQTEGLYSKAEDAHKNTERQYRTLAERNKLNPENVIVNYKIDPPKPPGPPLPPGSVPPEIQDAIRRAEEWKRSHPQ